MEVNPLASMRCWAVTIELGGREFDIPALPAVDWWPVLISGRFSNILDLLTSSDGNPVDLDTMLLSGEITGTDLSEAMADAISEVTGRTAHAAFVLAAVASASWHRVGGQLALSGFRWDTSPIGAALDAIYTIIASSLAEDKQDTFMAMLENEPVSEPGKKRTPSQKVVSEFEAMAGPRPAPAPLPGKASAEPSGSPRPRTQRQPRQPRPGGRSAAPKTQP